MHFDDSPKLPPEEIRLLFNRIGERIAQALPVARCDTVDELNSHFNARWDSIEWGFASLHEEADHLRITVILIALIVRWAVALTGSVSVIASFRVIATEFPSFRRPPGSASPVPTEPTCRRLVAGLL